MAARQTLTEAIKMEAQSAFNQIGTAYQDVLVHGHLMVHGGGMDRNNVMNMEIAEASYKHPEPDTPAPELDVEPEM